jgi:hypothetical protein
MNTQQLALLSKKHGIIWFDNHDVLDNHFKNHFICFIDKEEGNTTTTTTTTDTSIKRNLESKWLYKNCKYGHGPDHNANKEIKTKSTIMEIPSNLNKELINFGQAPDDVGEWKIKEREAKTICDFINDGLARGKMYVCSSMHVRKGNDNWFSSFLADNIRNYQENIKSGRLWLVDASTVYVSILCQDYKPLEQFKNELKKRMDSMDKDGGNHNEGGKNVEYGIADDSEVCIVCDCAGFLFKNKHFEQCHALEQWWIINLTKSIKRLSLYPAYLFDSIPYKYNTNLILSNESVSLVMLSK